MSHPSERLDDVVHQRVRLGILAVLAESQRADFSYLKDVLDLTDGNLSRHLRVLEEVDFVKIEKVFEDKRPRTWISATKRGRAAFAGELKTLEALIKGAHGALK